MELKKRVRMLLTVWLMLSPPDAATSRIDHKLDLQFEMGHFKVDLHLSRKLQLSVNPVSMNPKCEQVLLYCPVVGRRSRPAGRRSTRNS